MKMALNAFSRSSFRLSKKQRIYAVLIGATIGTILIEIIPAVAPWVLAVAGRPVGEFQSVGVVFASWFQGDDFAAHRLIPCARSFARGCRLRHALILPSVSHASSTFPEKFQNIFLECSCEC